MESHRVRRLKAKQDARKKTCAKHVGTHLVIKGTQTICPQCYLEYIQVHKRGVYKNGMTDEELADRVAQHMKERQEKQNETNK
jgi:hypothetical protein